MEVSAGSFSIREFALKARSVDGGKCWPFKGDDKDLKTEEILSRLPPIVCLRYRWWSDELAVARSTEKAKNLEARNTETRLLEGKAGTEFSEAVSSVGNVDPEAEKVSGVDEEGMVKICPVCETFTASTINAVNAHIDSCLAQASREERRQMRTAAAEVAAAGKSKSRMPKKRSILEIFAVAPQIETLDEEEECMEAGEEGDNENVSETSPVVTSKRKKRKQEKLKMVKKVEILKKKKMKKKKQMLKKTHGNGLLTQLAAEKGEVQNSKTPCAFHGQLLGNPSRPGKKIKDPGHQQKRKTSSKKGLSRKDQHKIIQASKLISKLQMEPPAFPLQSILKKQSSGSSEKKLSSTGQGFNVGNHQYVQQPNKHVRFSDKDDILGQPNKWNSSTAGPQTRCLSEMVSDVIIAPSVNNHSVEIDQPFPSLSEVQKVNRSGQDVSPSLTDGCEVRPLQLSDSHDHVTLPTVACSNGWKGHDTGKNSLGELVDLNRAVLPTNFPCPLFPEMLNSILEEGLNTNEGSHLECCIPVAPQASRTLPDPFALCVAKSAAANSLENMTRSAIFQSPLSLVATSMECNGKQPLLSQISWQNPNSNILQHQRSGQFSRKDLMTSLCSSMELKKQLALKNGQLMGLRMISDPVSVCRDMTVDEECVGLPLNSQGEFIQSHSRAKLGFNQLLKKQNTPLSSIVNFPVYNPAGPNNTAGHSNLKSKLHAAAGISSLRWFPEHNYLNDNRCYIPVSTRFGCRGLQDVQRTEAEYRESVRDKTQSIYQLDSEQNLMNSSWCKEYNQPHKLTEKGLQELGNLENMSQPTSQPTMRLMGKNVTVGRCSDEVNSSEDGNIWTDKEIIAEHRPVNVADKAIQRQFQQEWAVHPVSDPTHSVQTQCNLNSPSLLQMTTLNHRTHLTSRNGTPLITEDYSTRLCHTSQPTSSQQMQDKTSKLPQTGISGISNGHDTYPQHILFGSTHCKHYSSVPYRARSDPQLLVSDQECRGNIQPLWTQQSSSSLPQWLKNAAEQKQIQHCTPFQSSDSIPKHMPSPNFESKLSSLPCSYITSDISFPADSSSTSGPCLHSSSSESLVNPSLVPTFPGLTPTSANNSNLRNGAKIISGEKPKATYFRDPDHAKKSKKRAASKSEESTKLTKKPSIEMQDPNPLRGSKRRDCLHGYARYYTGSPEHYARRGKFVDMGISGLRTDKYTDGTTASVVSSFKFDSVQRPGPVKLSAGAKHILKPSRNMDDDNSRPIHSMIPFAMVPNSGKKMDFQKKSAKIYKF